MLAGAAVIWGLDWGCRIHLQDSLSHGCWLGLMAVVSHWLWAEGINSSPGLSTELPECLYRCWISQAEWFKKGGKRGSRSAFYDVILNMTIVFCWSQRPTLLHCRMQLHKNVNIRRWGSLRTILWDGWLCNDQTKIFNIINSKNKAVSWGGKKGLFSRGWDMKEIYFIELHKGDII